MIISEPTRSKFWSLVDVGQPSECWIWLAGLNSAGYGRFRIPSTPEAVGSQVLSHRLALTLVAGGPPEGRLEALHSCDNPPCCNPTHLRWGTHAENMAEMGQRGRAWPAMRETCSNGHPWTAENTLVGRHGARTYRRCRACKKASEHAAKLRRLGLSVDDLGGVHYITKETA